ncbi:MAG TPA: hypothetical protein VF392_00770 [Terracidiphilus sp.]
MPTTPKSRWTPSWFKRGATAKNEKSHFRGQKIRLAGVGFFIALRGGLCEIDFNLQVNWEADEDLQIQGED